LEPGTLAARITFTIARGGYGGVAKRFERGEALAKNVRSQAYAQLQPMNRHMNELEEKHNLAGKVMLQNSCGYLMLQIVVDILAVVFLIA
jgi:hypothetical protein